jgi:hypothetical protein
MLDSPLDHEDAVERHLRQYGLRPGGGELDQVRSVLAAETARESGEQGDGNAELMRLCCVQLFNAGLLDDVLLIWYAKMASFDTACGLDVQFLCGADLPKTKAFLTTQAQMPGTAEALEYLQECEAAGDFEDFTVEAWAARYARYFGQE